MAWWLVYERCEDCRENCLQCRREERELTIRAVEAGESPANALNGPCETPQIMLRRISEFFDFDPETGKMYFKVFVQ